MNKQLKQYWTKITDIIININNEINLDIQARNFDYLNYPSDFIIIKMKELDTFKTEFSEFYNQNKNNIDNKNLYYIKINKLLEFNL
jgi:hypothetical protein